MKVDCPQCKKPVEWEGNPFRPFCSDRCKLIDLGDWAMGKHAIPTSHSDADIDDKPSDPSDETSADGESPEEDT